MLVLSAGSLGLALHSSAKMLLRLSRGAVICDSCPERIHPTASRSPHAVGRISVQHRCRPRPGGARQPDPGRLDLAIGPGAGLGRSRRAACRAACRRSSRLKLRLPEDTRSAHSQGVGHPNRNVDSRIGKPALDHADVGAVDLRFASQLLLCLLARYPRLPEQRAKRQQELLDVKTQFVWHTCYCATAAARMLTDNGPNSRRPSSSSRLSSARWGAIFESEDAAPGGEGQQGITPDRTAVCHLRRDGSARRSVGSILPVSDVLLITAAVLSAHASFTARTPLIAPLQNGRRVKSDTVNGLPSRFKRHARQMRSVGVSPRPFQSLRPSMNSWPGYLPQSQQSPSLPAIKTSLPFST